MAPTTLPMTVRLFTTTPRRAKKLTRFVQTLPEMRMISHEVSKADVIRLAVEIGLEELERRRRDSDVKSDAPTTGFLPADDGTTDESGETDEDPLIHRRRAAPAHQRFAAWREKTETTYRAIESVIGRSPGTIGAYMVGRASPPADVRDRIEELTGIPASDPWLDPIE